MRAKVAQELHILQLINEFFWAQRVSRRSSTWWKAIPERTWFEYLDQLLTSESRKAYSAGNLLLAQLTHEFNMEQRFDDARSLLKHASELGCDEPTVSILMKSISCCEAGLEKL